jgi:hypothetical protein
MREGMEHGNFLGAWRSKILEQKRPALLVEVTATARHDLCYIPLRLDRGAIRSTFRPGIAPSTTKAT